MKQLNLFDDSDRSPFRPRPEKLVMEREALQQWKQRIYDHQQKVRSSQTPQQTALFEIPRQTWQTADEIDPFSLRTHPAEFYRRPEPPEPLDESNQWLIYLIIDNQWPILLYIGETKLTAAQRWKGTHYCRDYMANYIIKELL